VVDCDFVAEIDFFNVLSIGRFLFLDTLSISSKNQGTQQNDGQTDRRILTLYADPREGRISSRPQQRYVIGDSQFVCQRLTDNYIYNEAVSLSTAGSALER